MSLTVHVLVLLCSWSWRVLSCLLFFCNNEAPSSLSPAHLGFSPFHGKTMRAIRIFMCSCWVMFVWNNGTEISNILIVDCQTLNSVWTSWQAKQNCCHCQGWILSDKRCVYLFWENPLLLSDKLCLWRRASISALLWTRFTYSVVTSIWT